MSTDEFVHTGDGEGKEAPTRPGILAVSAAEEIPVVVFAAKVAPSGRRRADAESWRQSRTFLCRSETLRTAVQTTTAYGSSDAPDRQLPPQGSLRRTFAQISWSDDPVAPLVR